MWLKKLFAHRHKFCMIEWDRSLGPPVGEVHSWRFQSKILYECKCGERKVVTEWADI